jgi:DNA (cytosine-5)-methyltransferase 1
VIVSEEYWSESGAVVREVKAGRLAGLSRMPLLESEPTEANCAHLWWGGFLRGASIDSGSSRGKLSIVDIFCGSGGLSLGAYEAARSVGYSPSTLACIDVDSDALGVYARNFKPLEVLHENAASLIDCHVYGRGRDAELAYVPTITDRRLARIVGRVDLVVAGPPCQGHSNLNNHTRRADPRNQLYVPAVAMAIALSARAIVVENVPEVLRDSLKVVETATKILSDSGYTVSTATLNAINLGGGQTRRRHFLVATMSPHMEIELAAKALQKKHLSLRQIIGDLEHRTPSGFMDEVPVLSLENQSRIEYLFDNGMYDLPDKVRPNCHKNGTTYTSVYGRLSWDKPSQTITTGFLTPGRGRFIHPSIRRVLTPREAARIQGFPDTFDFIGPNPPPSRVAVSKWIGDAVPTQLGYSVVLAAVSGL